jgi:acyl carrier protein
MSIRERIINCFLRAGLRAEQVDPESITSIEFIYLLVELENEFSIDIPDYYFRLDILTSIDYLETVIIDLCEKSKP